MKIDPLVSVVLPTHDRLAYLREAVDSVFAQTVGDWELILADDGSTDGTVEWARTLDDPRVRLIELPRTANPAFVRNRALEAARGRWVAFLDSDDAWAPDKLEAQLAALRDAPGARWSYGDCEIMDVRGDPVSRERFRSWLPISGRITLPLLAYRAQVSCPSVMVERALLAEVGPFDEGLPKCEDFEMWLRLAEVAECVAVPGRRVRVRLHWGSSTRDNPRVEEDTIAVFRRFAAGTRSREARRVCRRQIAFHALRLAWRRGQRGDRAGSLRALATALRARPLDPHPWRALSDWARGRVPRRPPEDQPPTPDGPPRPETL